MTSEEAKGWIGVILSAIGGLLALASPGIAKWIRQRRDDRQFVLTEKRDATALFIASLQKRIEDLENDLDEEREWRRLSEEHRISELQERLRRHESIARDEHEGAVARDRAAAIAREVSSYLADVTSDRPPPRRR